MSVLPLVDILVKRVSPAVQNIARSPRAGIYALADIRGFPSGRNHRVAWAAPERPS
jgi:hypothetical protein